MAVDLRIDRLGDLVVTPANDFMLISGQELIEQRIRVRLRIPLGTWLLDPTGQLGSNLHDVTRVPVEQAISQIPLLVKEALAPMEEIRVEDVVATLDPNSPSTVNFTISYVVVDGIGEGEVMAFNDTVVVA